MCPDRPGSSAPAGRWGGGGLGRGSRFSHLHLLPSARRARALRAQPAWGWSHPPEPNKRARRPARPPHLGRPRPPGPRPQREAAPKAGSPGAGRRGGGGEAATAGRVRAERGAPSAKPPRGGGASPAVRPRDWPGPPRRPPLIGGFSNSASRRQRRCFSGDRAAVAVREPGRRGVPASEGRSEPGLRDSLSPPDAATRLLIASPPDPT